VVVEVLHEMIDECGLHWYLRLDGMTLTEKSPSPR
jgi:hypothetical protein